MDYIERKPHTESGKNQTLTRDINLSLIMRVFMKQAMSKVDISRYFKLSKPTSAKIISELEKLDFICPDPSCELDRSLPGVKPLKYRLNSRFGLLAVIDMSSVETRIQLCDFGGAILCEKKIANKELITYRDILAFCDVLDGIYAEYRAYGKTLLAVCAAMPCAVNRRNGKIDWSSRFEIEESFDLNALLAQRYPESKIIIENDVQLMLSGEIYSGLLADGSISYALLMYVDAGLGGSFYMNGKLESGEDGKAGDLGFLPFLNRNGEYVYLDSAISINAMKKTIRRELLGGAKSCLANTEKLHFADILQAYADRDPLAVRIVEETAHETAQALQSIVEILNINFIIVSGRITQFGDSYKNVVETDLKKRFPDVRIQYSAIQDFAIHEGAVFVASDRIIGDVISNRTKKIQ